MLECLRAHPDARHPPLGGTGDGGRMALTAGGALWATEVPVQGTSGAPSQGRSSSPGPARPSASSLFRSPASAASASRRPGSPRAAQHLPAARRGDRHRDRIDDRRHPPETLLGEGQAPSAALTGGFHWALWACGTIALLALPATATFARRKTSGRFRGGRWIAAFRRITTPRSGDWARRAPPRQMRERVTMTTGHMTIADSQ